MDKCVLAVDPGTVKCGLAVVCKGKPPIWHAVISKSQIAETALDLISKYSPTAIVIGAGTGSAEIVSMLQAHVSLPVKIVSEKYTSEQARKRWFCENPPRGLKRFIPISLLTPDVDIDDYAAIILAENYLEGTVP